MEAVRKVFEVIEYNDILNGILNGFISVFYCPCTVHNCICLYHARVQLRFTDPVKITIRSAIAVGNALVRNR